MVKYVKLICSSNESEIHVTAYYSTEQVTSISLCPRNISTQSTQSRLPPLALADM